MNFTLFLVRFFFIIIFETKVGIANFYIAKYGDKMIKSFRCGNAMKGKQKYYEQSNGC